MLSLTKPTANILLRRKFERRRFVETEHVRTDSENWMEPFGLALGIDNDAFSNWRHVLFKRSNRIILVEGETDKSYLEMLRDTVHGQHALAFEGEIFPYGGTGFFENTVLVKFIMSRFNRFVITFDLDQETRVSKCLTNLGLKKNSHYIAIGIDSPGKRDIEGLLPDKIRTAVYSKFPDLVAVAMSTEKDRDSAKRQLKARLLEEFKACSQPNKEYFEEFYKISSTINKIVQ
jgi:hypothetical protein